MHRLAPGQQVRALVVDDKIENQEILQRVLTRVGVEVVLAAEGGPVQGLAARLHELARQFDMKAIGALLEKVRRE